METPAISQSVGDRITAVFDAIRTGNFPNAVTLARALEVTPRTIKRDIDVLRVNHGLDIAYNKARHGYFLADPTQGFPGGRFTEAEVLALFVARQALAAYRGTAVEQILSDGFRRLERRLDGDQRYTLGDLAGLLSFRAPAPEEIGAETFSRLTQSLRDQLEVRFRYQGLADNLPKVRRVRGYHLGCVDHKWYLFGWDIARTAIRTFALSRMTEVEVSTRPYARPKNFDIAETLRGAFGVHSGEPGRTVEVRIRFDAWASRLIRERQWHPTQALEDAPDAVDPGLVLTLRLSGLEEIRRWILSWGEHAEVLAPTELSEWVRETAETIARNHRPKARRTTS